MNLPTEHIQTIKEEMFLAAKGFFPDAYKGNYKRTDRTKDQLEWGYSKPKMVIHRNLRDDTYNVQFNAVGRLPWTLTTRFQINSKLIKNDFKEYERESFDILDRTLNHSMFNDLKFSKTSNISSGMDHIEHVFYKSIDRGNDVGGFLLMINNINKSQNISVSSDKIINIKTINNITVEKSESLKGRYNKYKNDEFVEVWHFIKSDFPNEQKVNIKKYYNNIYLVPRPISRLSHNNVLYDVYMNNEDKSPIIKDINISKGIMSTSSTGSQKFGVSFHSKLKENKFKTINSEVSQYIGTIEVDDYSHYDYEKKQSVIGPSMNSNIGDIVPYSLEGDYTRNIKLGLNVDYDAMSLYQIQNFEYPILDKYNGTVQLQIKSQDNDKHIEMNEITNDQKKLLRNTDEIISLREYL